MPDPIDPSMLPESDREKFGINGEPITENPEEVSPEVDNTEFELTPEIEAMIMDKVKDVNQTGTAFKCLGRIPKPGLGENYSDEEMRKRIKEKKDEIISVLRNGILGDNWARHTHEESDRLFKESNYTDDLKGHWAHNVRTLKNAQLHFHITGQSAHGQSPLYNVDFAQPGNIEYIFDLNYFRDSTLELDDKYKYGGNPSDDPAKRRTYRINQYIPWALSNPEEYARVKAKNDNKHGEGISDGEYGFVAYHRVPPHIIQGMAVVRYTKDHDLQSQKDDLQIDFVAKAQIEANKDRPNLLVPIYDTDGNLLWPKQMSYEEVKAFVAERDKNIPKDQADSQEPQEEIES